MTVIAKTEEGGVKTSTSTTDTLQTKTASGTMTFKNAGGTSVGSWTDAGYWSLGPSAPAFAMKRFSGTTDGSGAFSVSHGLSSARIVLAQGGVVTGGASNERYAFHPYWDDSNLKALTGYANKAYVVYVFYEA
jgi:hypothetical protein